MVRINSWAVRSALAAAGLAAFAVGCGDKNFPIVENVVVPLNIFHQNNLVADLTGTGAITVDANLVNPWGIAFGPSGALWVANNGTGTSTVYNPDGTALPLTVTIPGGVSPMVNPLTPGMGVPTGVIFNTTASDFTIPGAGSAAFIFAGEDGSISAWNTTTATTAQLVADRSGLGASYKGIAMAFDGTANHVYATNFAQNTIDMFDGSFAFVKSFTDSTAPAGFAPFGIANIGNQLWVTYAVQLAPTNHDDSPGVGNGFVDVFNPDGSLARRFLTAGRLNSPWAIAQAPAGFVPFPNAVLIGNFGDGTIGAYDMNTGALLDVLRDANSNPIVISGLWGLAFGPVSSSPTLYFAAGVAGETHGLVGTLTRP